MNVLGVSPYGLSPVSGYGQSPFGGLAPFGSISLNIGLAPPPPILLPYGSSGTAPVGTSLRASSGGLVSVGTANDQAGHTVITATLGSTRGGIIGFQSAPPTGLALTNTPPAHPGALPTVTDSTGKIVPYSVSYDQYGGAVLQIQLTDINGRTTKLYSQVDSLGYPVSGGPPATASAAFNDLSGVAVPVSTKTDQFGNTVNVATVTAPNGTQVQYETQSPGAANLNNTLSTTNPAGPQNPQAGPTDAKGNTIGNLTLYTAAGNTVDQITLYSSSGVPTTFYSAKDSAGNATQALQLTSVATTAPLKAFSTNPALTATNSSSLPGALHPYTTPSSTPAPSGFLGNPYALSLFNPQTFGPRAIFGFYA